MTSPLPIIWTGVTGVNEMMIRRNSRISRFFGNYGMSTSVCDGNETIKRVDR